MSMEETTTRRKKSWSHKTLECLMELLRKTPQDQDILVDSISMRKLINCPDEHHGGVSGLLTKLSRPNEDGKIALTLVGKKQALNSRGLGCPPLFVYKVERDTLPFVAEKLLTNTRAAPNLQGRKGRGKLVTFRRDVKDLPLFNETGVIKQSNLDSPGPRIPLVPRMSEQSDGSKIQKLKAPELVDYLLNAAIGIEEHGPTREWLIDIIKSCAQHL